MPNFQPITHSKSETVIPNSIRAEWSWTKHKTQVRIADLFFSKLYYILLILVCASWEAFPNTCDVLYRKPFFYLFTRIRRPKPDFICIRICFSLLYYSIFNKENFFSVEVYLLFAVCTAPERALLLVASLVALYHSIVKLLVVKVSSSSDLPYFLQVAGQFPSFWRFGNDVIIRIYTVQRRLH